MNVYNSGDLVEREVDVQSFSGTDAIEELISEIRTAAEDLEDVRVETRFDEDPYGGFGSHVLLIAGRPTGNLAVQAKAQHAERVARERDARLEGARRLIAEEERRSARP